MSEETPRISYLALIAAILFGLWLRMPFIGKDLPYFYNEDEAHHFNRLVNMVKSGDFNPHYFNKPSFHFYTRIPPLVGSFFYGVSKGQIRTIEEIKTGDPFGLNGYSMSASHPFIVKGNRAFSVALSLLTILFSFLATRLIFGGPLAPPIAAWLVAVSPGFVSESATIGVDPVVVFLAISSLALTLRIEFSKSIWTIIIAGLVTGLTISTKYNAWPIFILPLLGCWAFKRYEIDALILAAITPIIGFCLGSPFIFAEFPLFLNHAAFEVWHYKIAGHIGNEATPGWDQLIHYGSWLGNNSIGWPLLFISLLGSAAGLAKRNRKLVLVSLFPLLYFAYMISQKANFTRNMLVLIPFLAVLGAGFFYSASLLIKHNIRRLALLVVTPLLLLFPTMQAISVSTSARELTPETRTAVMEEILKALPSLSDTALSGNLNFEPQAYGLPGVSRIDETKLRVAELYLKGFDRIIVGSKFTPSDEELKLLHLERFFPGDTENLRVVKNPEIKVFRFSDSILDDIALLGEIPKPICNDTEDYCWISTRIAHIDVDLSSVTASDNVAHLQIKLQTPWPGQSVTFGIADWAQTIDSFDNKIGTWVDVDLAVPLDRLTLVSALRVMVSQIHSPKTQKVSEDPRRLGVAIKGNGLIMR